MDTKENSLQDEFKKIFMIYVNKFPFRSFHKSASLLLFLVIIGLFFLGVIIYPQNYELTLFCFLQGTFCLLGFYFLNAISKKHDSKGKQIEIVSKLPDSTSNILYSRLLTIVFWIFCLGYILIRLFSLSHIPSDFQLETEEIVLFWYAILVSFSEEIFFRGFLISIFLNLRSGSVKTDLDSNCVSISKMYKIKFKELLFIVILQSIIWTLLHVNYYGDISALIPIFVSGILFGLLFVFKKDIRIPIILHMFGNLIANFEMFF